MMSRFLILAITAFVGWQLNKLPVPTAPSNVGVLASVLQSPIPAFPGAVGYGAEALDACRALPLVVHRLTSLDGDVDGTVPGSFFYIAKNFSDTNFDVVVFTTGGTINMNGGGPPDIGKHCVYFAGQTAPGGGIQAVTDTTLPFGLFHHGWAIGVTRVNEQQHIGVDDWVMRYMRVRSNSTDSTGLQGGNFVNAGGDRQVYDHMSFGCGDDKEMTFDIISGVTAIIENVTVSHSILYACINQPGASTPINFTGPSTLTGLENPDSVNNNLTIYHTYMGVGNWRLPRVTHTRNVQLVGNIAFGHTSPNYARFATHMPGGSRMRLESIGNRTKPGTLNSNNYGTVEFQNLNNAFPIIYSYRNVNGLLCGGDPSCDQTRWRLSKQLSGLVPDSSFRSSSPLETRPTFDVDLATTAAIDNPTWPSLFDDLGADASVDCSGLWLPNRDAVDVAFLKEFSDSLAIHGEWLADYGPFGRAIQLDPGSACADADADGLPDAFETLCVGDATSMTPGGDLGGDGYLNIEEYANGTNSTGRDLDWNDNSSDEDGFHIERDKGSGWVRFASVGANVESYFDIDARVGDDYRVVAYNAFGESAPSNIDSAECR